MKSELIIVGNPAIGPLAAQRKARILEKQFQPYILGITILLCSLVAMG
jgi:hypothetical protein